MEFSIEESVKTIAKSSPRNILFITFIFLLPLSLFQILFVCNLLEIVILVTNERGKSMVSYFIYNFVYLVLFLTFYLLSSSSMIFTMASLYVSKPFSCISTLLAIPRLSKRILITFLHALPLMICAYLANFAFVYLYFYVVAKMNSLVACIFANICGHFVTYADAYVIGLWNLANVISVVEPNVHGLSAMKMSKQLLRESPCDAILFVWIYSVVSWVILVIESLAVFMEYDNYNIARIQLIAFCVIIMSGVNFVALIGQSVLYYVCKNQVIDKEVLQAQLAGKESGNRGV